MITYTWTINQLYTVDSPEPGFVCTAVWTLTGDQNGTTASVGGVTEFTQSGDIFTPYDQLTETQVIGWVQQTLGSVEVSNLEINVQAQINSIVNPPIVPQNPPLPW